MPADALKCKECQTTYPLEARFVCERCFGPLEVSYTLPSGDPEALKRKIQAGPHTMWRYADFLPLEGPARSALPTGWTPLVKADRLAEKLGLREVWIKNETANPTHSFKDRVVSVALARAKELGFDTLACASTGNLANAVAAHAAAAGMPAYVLILDRWAEMPHSWRFTAAVALFLTSFTIFDVLRRTLYTQSMLIGVVSVGAVLMAACLLQLRWRAAA